MLVIFYFSSLQGDQLGPDNCIIDVIKKLGHSVIYGVLAILYLWALKGSKALPEARIPVFVLSFVLVLLYAVTDEYHQSFTPGRHATVTDVIIDAAGAIVCLAFLYGKSLEKKGNK
jgi:VanZ family protein